MVNRLGLVRDVVQVESIVILGEGDLVARYVSEERVQLGDLIKVKGCFGPIATV